MDFIALFSLCKKAWKSEPFPHISHFITMKCECPLLGSTATFYCIIRILSEYPGIHFTFKKGGMLEMNNQNTSSNKEFCLDAVLNSARHESIM